MRNTIYRFKSFFSSRSRWWLVYAMVATILLSLLDIVIAKLMLAVLSFIGFDFTVATNFTLLDDIQETPSYLLVVFILVGLLRFLAQYTIQQCSAEIIEGVQLKLRLALVKSMLQTNPNYLNRSKDAMYWHGSVITPASICVYSICQTVFQLFQSLLFFFTLFYIAPKEALVGLVGVALIGSAVYITSRVSQKALSIVPEMNTKVGESFKNIEQNLLLIRLAKAEGLEFLKAKNSLNVIFKAACRSCAKTNIVSALTPFAGVLLLVSILFISVSKWDTDKTTLLMFFYIFVRFVQGLAFSSGTISNATQYSAQYKEAAQFLHENVNMVASNTNFQGCRSSVKSLSSKTKYSPPYVVADQLGYNVDGRSVIQNMSFRLEAGSITAIVGPSGSGKSTLLMLLLGLLEARSGRVSIGGNLVSNPLYQSSLQIGYVGPEAFITEGTVIENICYFEQNVQFDDSKAVDSLKRAGLYEDIMAADDGLFRKIGLGGVGLSSGQKQKLALSRVFYAEPQIIILDEATANMDDVSERNVVEQLRRLKGRSTIVFVTHRPYPKSIADSVIEMNKLD